jgi:hypothetical protein
MRPAEIVGSLHCLVKKCVLRKDGSDSQRLDIVEGYLGLLN